MPTAGSLLFGHHSVLFLDIPWISSSVSFFSHAQGPHLYNPQNALANTQHVDKPIAESTNVPTDI